MQLATEPPPTLPRNPLAFKAKLVPPCVVFSISSLNLLVDEAAVFAIVLVARVFTDVLADLLPSSILFFGK